MYTAKDWIEHLQMTAHPEGGHYKECYKSNEAISDAELTQSFTDTRALATSIYFLLENEEISHLHRLQQDELWYYHAGEALRVWCLNPNSGELTSHDVGPDFKKGQTLQLVVPGGTIFGSEVLSKSGYSLVGCMVTPGFDFRDFELFSAASLIEKFPHHKEIITRMAISEM